MIRIPSLLLAATLPFMLSGCGITDWADANMPVIGDRCEHWQCFTSSGQAESQANHDERVHEARTPANADMPNPGGPMQAAPQAAPQPAARTAPAVPLESAIPEEPTNVYVPRSAPPPGTTPFDGNFQPPE